MEKQGLMPGDHTDVLAETSAKLSEGVKALVASMTSPLDEKKLLFAPANNFSRAQKVFKALVGPQGRVWHRPGQPVEVGEELPGGGREVLGQGATFPEALLDAARELTPEEIIDLAGPELRSVHSADGRRPTLVVR